MRQSLNHTDASLTVGFGRPETEGFESSTIDCSVLMEYLQSSRSDIGMFSTPESAACVMAYVDLANVAREYSRFVNLTLKVDPMRCAREMGDIGARLDAFSSRWLWARTSEDRFRLTSRISVRAQAWNLCATAAYAI